MESDKITCPVGQNKQHQVQTPDVNQGCSNLPAGITSISFDRNGRSILVSSGERAFYANLRDNLRLLQSQKGQILTTSLSDDSDLSAIGSSDGIVNIFSNRDGRLLHTINSRINDREHLGDLCAMSFSANGNSISIFGSTGMKTFSIQDDGTLQYDPAINCPAKYSVNNTYIASANNFASKSDAIFLQKNDAGRITIEAMTELDSEKGPVASVAISNNGQLVALSQAGYDITIFRNHVSWIPSFLRFSTKSLDYSGKLIGHKGAITSLTVSPDGEKIGSGSLDRTVRIWNAMDGVSIHAFADDSAPVRVVKFSPNGQCIVAGNDNGILRFLNSQSGAHLASINLSCSKDVLEQNAIFNKSLHACFR